VVVAWRNGEERKEWWCWEARARPPRASGNGERNKRGGGWWGSHVAGTEDEAI